MPTILTQIEREEENLRNKLMSRFFQKAKAKKIR